MVRSFSQRRRAYINFVSKEESEEIKQMHKYSSVGSVIERMRMQIIEDKRLRKRIAELEKKLIMSQEQI